MMNGIMFVYKLHHVRPKKNLFIIKFVCAQVVCLGRLRLIEQSFKLELTSHVKVSLLSFGAAAPRGHEPLQAVILRRIDEVSIQEFKFSTVKEVAIGIHILA